jgi:aldose 1-epimerase
MPDATMPVARDIFGILPDGRAVERVALRDASGFEAHIMTYGAALQALWVPDARSGRDDVVLGYDDLAGYFGTRGFFGASVGRYANRIANARFVIEGRWCNLPPMTVRMRFTAAPTALTGGFGRSPKSRTARSLA